MPGAATCEQIIDQLGLRDVRGKKWYVQPSIATRGDGIYEGLDWLSTALAKIK